MTNSTFSVWNEDYKINNQQKVTGCEGGIGCRQEVQMGFLSGDDDDKAEVREMRRSQSNRDLREENSRQKEKFGAP